MRTSPKRRLEERVQAAQQPKKIFMLGGFKQDEKLLLIEQIEQLGGQVFDATLSLSDWQRTTHVVLKQIRRTEKLICGLSKGAWILNEDFVTKSIEQGHFVDEEAFEWFAEETVFRNNEAVVWMGAMKRWRQAEQLPFARFRFAIINSEGLQPPASLLHIMSTIGGSTAAVVLTSDQDESKIASLIEELNQGGHLFVVARDGHRWDGHWHHIYELLHQQSGAFDVVTPMEVRDYLLLHSSDSSRPSNRLGRVREAAAPVPW